MSDINPAAGIGAGANVFRIVEVGVGWADDGMVQTAAQVDGFVDANGLELLGVGRATLTDPYEIA